MKKSSSGVENMNVNPFNFLIKSVSNSSSDAEPQDRCKMGQHRSKETEGESILNSSETSRADKSKGRGITRSQYLTKFMLQIEDFNKDFEEIKRINKSCHQIQTNSMNGEDSTEYRHLKKRYESICENMKPALLSKTPMLSEFYHLLEQLKPEDILIYDENSKLKIIKKSSVTEDLSKAAEKAFLEITSLFLTSLGEGRTSFIYSKNDTQDNPIIENFSLFEILKMIGSTKWAQELIFSKKEIYFEFTNIYIFALSKNLELSFPLKKELENQFLDIISFIAETEKLIGEHVFQQNVIDGFLATLHIFAQHTSQELETAKVSICKKLSELSEPKPSVSFIVPDLSSDPAFNAGWIIDDPGRESRHQHLQNILQEIIRTEILFHEKIHFISNKCWDLSDSGLKGTFFEFLKHENVIETVTLNVVTVGWSELQESSGCLSKNCSIATTTNLIKQIETCLLAFSPEHMYGHLKNFKSVICNYTVTDKMIKGLQRDAKGKELLSKFKAMNKVDIIDVLIMPVQRPPRYILLLNECLKAMEPGLATNSLSDRVLYLQKWVQSINYLVDPNQR